MYLGTDLTTLGQKFYDQNQRNEAKRKLHITFRQWNLSGLKTTNKNKIFSSSQTESRNQGKYSIISSMVNQRLYLDYLQSISDSATVSPNHWLYPQELSHQSVFGLLYHDDWNLRERKVSGVSLKHLLKALWILVFFCAREEMLRNIISRGSWVIITANLLQVPYCDGWPTGKNNLP